MQKTGLLIIIFGILISAGLGIAVIENQITLEGIVQGNGKVNTEQVITISVNLDKEETPVGIFAVQIMDFKENTFSVKIIDPSDTEIISKKIDTDTVEQEFEVVNS
ncbi:MAG: hypothetical protein HOG44_03345, partial [Nitrosopumilus sp.]|nr:hypothetical protein [Nitrosopumilus sp.]